MRIAILTHNVLKGDGQGRVNYELARVLLSRGIEVELFAGRIDDDLLDAGAAWTRIRPGNEAVNLFKVWRFAQLADRALNQRNDKHQLVLACGFVTRHPHAINVAHFVHGSWLQSPYHSSRVRRGINPLYQRIYTTLNARWELQSFAKAETVVALSPMVRRELIEIGVPQEKIEIVVNGVDLDEFKPGAKDRRTLGLPENVGLGLFVGDLRSPIKNLDIVLQGLVGEPSLHLGVVGDQRGSVYPALAEQLGLRERVHFLGFRRDVADIMRSVDFFVLASRRDSCPLVLLEAMASGLPIITATTVGSSNLVTEELGFVIDGPEDIDGLCAGFRVMAHDPSAIQKMGEASRAKAEMYSWEHMGDQYIDMLETHSA